MIILVANKSIMRLNLPKNAFFELLGNFDLMKKGWSGDWIIIRNFDLMKSDKKFDLMNLTSWKNEFRSHEIRPHDHFPILILKVIIFKLH